jgi:hypothetical protein
VDLFPNVSSSGPVIITITDENTAYSISTFAQDEDHESLVSNLHDHWFHRFRFPQEILLKKGKVELSRLTQKINQLMNTTTLLCRSGPSTFNTEIEQQWKLTQQHLPEAEFVNAVNFSTISGIQNLVKWQTKSWRAPLRSTKIKAQRRTMTKRKVWRKLKKNHKPTGSMA